MDCCIYLNKALLCRPTMSLHMNLHMSYPNSMPLRRVKTHRAACLGSLMEVSGLDIGVSGERMHDAVFPASGRVLDISQTSCGLANHARHNAVQGTGNWSCSCCLAQVSRLLPAEQSPTISGLLDSDFVALEVVLDERVARDLVPVMRRLGAAGVITYNMGLILH